MRTLPTTLFGVALLAATTASARAETRSLEIPLSRPGEPVVLDIDLMAGEIHVTGEDRNDVLLELTAAPSGRTIITPSGPKEVPGSGLQLEIEEYDNELEIDSDAQSSRVVVRARVPRNTSISAETVHDGVIVIQDVTGDLELENVHGPITATGIRGSVVAETVQGEVTVELLAVPAAKPMGIETLHGDISLSLPSDYGAELHILSAGDEVFTDFEVELVPFDPQVARREEGGRFVVEMNREIVAAINGGGPQITLESRYGEVRVLKSGR